MILLSEINVNIGNCKTVILIRSSLIFILYVYGYFKSLMPRNSNKRIKRNEIIRDERTSNNRINYIILIIAIL